MLYVWSDGTALDEPADYMSDDFTVVRFYEYEGSYAAKIDSRYYPIPAEHLVAGAIMHVMEEVELIPSPEKFDNLWKEINL